MLERVNQNWMTRQWNENDLSHDDIETLIEVEMYMNDFTFWKGGEWFHMSHFLEIQRIYMGWYEGIPQYVGESEHFSRRMGQHLNHNGSKDKTHDPTKVKVFDWITYFDVPKFNSEKNFHLKVEWEMINRYRLNRDADGFYAENDRGKEDKRFQPNFIRKVFNRFDGNFQTEQLELAI